MARRREGGSGAAEPRGAAGPDGARRPRFARGGRLPALAALAALLLAAAPAGAAGDDPPAVRSPAPVVLFLSSYHPGYDWSDGELEGFRGGLSKRGVPADVRVEYLWAKHDPAGQHLPAHAAYLRSRYGSQELSLVVAADDPALHFLLAYRERLFPGVPALFLGVDAARPPPVDRLGEATGVLEGIDPRGTLEAAFALQPGARRVFFLHDGTETGILSRVAAEGALQPFLGRASFEFLEPLPAREVLDRARALPKDSFLVVLSWARDSEGAVFGQGEFTSRLRAVSAVPVYGVHAGRLGHGIAGGALVDPAAHGDAAAEVAVRILAGAKASSIPVAATPGARLVFDGRELDRLGLDPAALPAGAEVRYRPAGSLRRHGAPLLLGAAALAVLSLGLALQAARNRRLVAARDGLAEAARRSEEERARTEAILSSMAEGVSIQDREYRVLYQNEAHRRIVGGHLGHFCYRGFHGRDTVCDDCPVEAVFRDGLPHTVSKESLRDGATRSYEITASPIADRDGVVTSAIEVVRDVGERKALEREQRLQAAVMEYSVDGVLAAGLDGRVVYANPAALVLLGYGRWEEIAGREIASMVPAGEEGPGREVTRLLREEGAWRGEVRARRKDGTTVPLELRAFVFHDPDDGEPAGFAFVGHDITERLRMEEELRRSRRLEELGNLAGGIAHDFNNILTAILGNLSLARLAAREPERLLPRLEEAERSVVAAKTLTGQLLTFSQGGAPVKETTSLGDLVRDSAAFVLRGSPCRCDLDVPDDLWPADVDPVQLSQVVGQLVRNGAQAMGGGGVVTVRCRNAPACPSGEGSQPERPCVAISVEDRGPGISPELLPRIFDPYFTTKSGSTGLGLPAVHSIVERHGGMVTVESEQGRGSVFTVWLPASPGKAVRRGGEPPEGGGLPVPAPGRRRVLVMDDEQSVRDVLGGMLESLGYEVELCGDGAEAVRRHGEARERGAPFDAILVDLTVPGGMGGLEATRRIREAEPSVRAVVMSGYSQDAVMAEHGKHGYRGMLRKPFRLVELARVMQEVLG